MSAPLLLEFSAIDLPSQGKITTYTRTRLIPIYLRTHADEGWKVVSGVGVFSQIAATGGGKSDGSSREREREREREGKRVAERER